MREPSGKRRFVWFVVASDSMSRPMPVMRGITMGYRSVTMFKPCAKCKQQDHCSHVMIFIAYCRVCVGDGWYQDRSAVVRWNIFSKSLMVMVRICMDSFYQHR